VSSASAENGGSAVNPQAALASSLHKLQKRAFGGEDVAARPGTEDDDWWPRAPLLPGVEELIRDFVDGEGGETLRIDFLLGGAGNGKSYAARSLGRELGLQSSPDDPLAYRKYSTQCGSRRVELLNDATIAPAKEYESRQGYALACDIQDWWEASAGSRMSAFCCVNRGIVIDELRSVAVAGGEVGVLPRTILAWLATPEYRVAEELGVELLPPQLDLGDHYRELNFRLDDRVVRISALSVDACSLLERDEDSSRAGTLFQQVVACCRDEALSRRVDCPIRANVEQWLYPEAIKAWENVMEHAEIASGRLHSYRDVWGLAALSILGPRFSIADGSSTPLDHIDMCLGIATGTGSAAERLQAWLELSHFRVANALFWAPVPDGKNAVPRYPPTTPAHHGLSLIDPSSWGCGKSKAVEEAMQDIALGGMPSKTLLAKGDLDGAWFPFDASLEDALVKYVGSDECPDVVRRRLISWYGGYLMRLVGLSNKHLGNHATLTLWKHLRSRALNGNERLPLEFNKAIRALIFPQHEDAPHDCILIPAFAARVEPLQTDKEGANPRLLEVVPHGSIGLRVRQRGGRLLLECTLAGETEIIGQLVLDFQLIREALACRDQRAGQTESTAYVEPRVERCRASSLDRVPGSDRTLVVMSAGKLMELQ
jgi:hypothetical protein